MGAEMERVETCVRYIREKTGFEPHTALVLGSGLGGFADNVKIEAVVEYGEIEGFPVSTVSGHKGRFVLGYVGKEPVAVMQGRVHYYEGYPMRDVVLPIRVMARLGARRLILTNAAGGIHPDFAAGALMLLTDHISSFIPSPLLGPNEEAFGLRFPDMSEVYSRRLRTVAEEEAGKLGIPVKQGVYLQTTGPNYETPAEIRMFRTLGADAVGMSTACEAMTARHLGLEVCGISCITNLAAGISKAPLSHEEVKATADRVAEDFQALLRAMISRMTEL